MNLTIYTDGSCLKNPNGPGGWAVVVMTKEGEMLERSGYEPMTTNNRMEMIAALEGLRVAMRWKMPKDPNEPVSVVINSDSKYVLDGIGTWIEGWKRNDWKNSQGKPVVNRDLWEELDAAVTQLKASGVHLNWMWVRGHNGNPGNELADHLAGRAAREQSSCEAFRSAEEATARKKNPKIRPVAPGADPSLGFEEKGGVMPTVLDLSLPDEQLIALVRKTMAASQGGVVSFQAAESQSTRRRERMRA